MRCERERSICDFLALLIITNLDSFFLLFGRVLSGIGALKMCEIEKMLLKE